MKYQPAPETGGYDDEHWKKWYVSIVKELIKNQKAKRHLPHYLEFRGWDEHLQFDPANFPKDFGLKNKVYVVPAKSEISEQATVTMKISEESFILVGEDGDFGGLLDPVWYDKTGGNVEAIVEVIMEKIRWSWQSEWLKK
jgi:hypothetical protein